METREALTLEQVKEILSSISNPRDDDRRMMALAHVFRHSYLTLLAGTGINVKTLQTIGGHADIQTTMNRYDIP